MAYEKYFEDQLNASENFNDEIIKIVEGRSIFGSSFDEKDKALYFFWFSLNYNNQQIEIKMDSFKEEEFISFESTFLFVHRKGPFSEFVKRIDVGTDLMIIKNFKLEEKYEVIPIGDKNG